MRLSSYQIQFLLRTDLLFEKLPKNFKPAYYPINPKRYMYVACSLMKQVLDNNLSSKVELIDWDFDSFLKILDSLTKHAYDFPGAME